MPCSISIFNNFIKQQSSGFYKVKILVSTALQLRQVYMAVHPMDTIFSIKGHLGSLIDPILCQI